MRFLRILVKFAKLNTREIFFKVAIMNIITCKKSQNTKIISQSSTIIFLASLFFDLRFCNISQMLLDVTSFFSCCYFCCPEFVSACFPSPFATKRKYQSFLLSLVRYKCCLTALHIKLKVGGLQHFHSSLRSPQTELQSHLQRLAVCHQQKKIEIHKN